MFVLALPSSSKNREGNGCTSMIALVIELTSAAASSLLSSPTIANQL